jgi:ArsR family transcriptional regulator
MDISLMLKALGEPTRFRIYQQILSRKHCVRSLSKKLSLTESAVSQHMKVLRETGLVYGERYGYHIHYLPTQEALDALCDAFGLMKEQSRTLCRDAQTCQCEFREETKK